MLRGGVLRLKPAAILDIGSSKVVCLCGSSVHTDGILVHGVGICEYAGFENGEFNDMASLGEAVLTAIEDAEQQSCTRIREVAVAVPAPFVKLITTRATLHIESRNRRITVDDIDDVISMSLEKARAPEHLLMHSTPVSFTVGGIESATVPEGARADELSAEVSHMYVRESFVQQMERILSSMHVEISMCVSAQLAEAIHIIPEQERVRPAVLIDVGYTHTDVCLIENAALTNLQSFELGGQQFASDLSFGLDIPLEYAEQVKRRYTFLQEPLSSVEIIRMPTGVKRVDHRVVDLIVDARAQELAGLLKKALRDMGIRPESRPVIYLTGGGISMMHGSGEYLRQQLGYHVRRDMPSYMHEMNSPNYTSAFGALDFVLRASNESEAAAQEPSAGSLWDRILDKLRNLLIK